MDFRDKSSDFDDAIGLAPTPLGYVKISGAAAQFALMAVLGSLGAAGLGWAMLGSGAMADIAMGMLLYGAAAALAFKAMAERYPHGSIGLCNAATLLRLTLTSVLAMAAMAMPGPSWTILALAALAFGLDGLDGWLARREGLVSEVGARFDMEVDSALALILAVLAYQTGAIGAAVLLLGVPRYLFGAAQVIWPWLSGPLPERFSRKVVCVGQISALIVVLMPLSPAPLAVASVLVAAGALLWSFWVDVRALWQAR